MMRCSFFAAVVAPVVIWGAAVLPEVLVWSEMFIIPLLFG